MASRSFAILGRMASRGFAILGRMASRGFAILGRMASRSFASDLGAGVAVLRTGCQHPSRSSA